ncbi:glycosyltransferase family 2 protein [Campylobacter lari]|nr:glycosyltransferase family 2 protein [Campylobacter lari]EFT8704671.1 glycosyltransferase family 2 protein [Campylobacter lari]EFT8805501.1 glycosyltransferase family 2 protein [Campylobacter lari]
MFLNTFEKDFFYQTKTVGVVIPIYNVEKYLRECLDSVINQSYTNLEIILVNDGSTDENSLNIAKEYTLKDKRITLFDKKNGGLSSARNVGIEYFSGEYKLKNKTQTIKENSLIEFNIEGNNPYEIYTVYKSYKAFNDEKDLTKFTYPIIDYIIFLDSDDYWELNCIEECVPRMDGVEIVWFDSRRFLSELKHSNHLKKTLLESYNIPHECKINKKEWLVHTIENKIQSFWFSVNGLICFSFLKKIHLKFLNGIMHEDNLFGTILFLKANNIYLFTEKKYNHRIRPNSIMNHDNIVTEKNIPEYMYDKYNHLILNPVAIKSYHRAYSWYRIVYCLLEIYPNLTNEVEKIFIERSILIYYNAIFHSIGKEDYIFLYLCDKFYMLENNIKSIFNSRDIRKVNFVGAVEKIQNHLSYKIGLYLINVNKMNIIKDFYNIYKIFYFHKKQIAVSKIIQCDQNHPLSYYSDYNDGFKLKRTKCYKVGKSFVDISKKWYIGIGFIFYYVKFYYLRGKK